MKAVRIDRDIKKLVPFYLSGTIQNEILHGKLEGDSSKLNRISKRSNNFVSLLCNNKIRAGTLRNTCKSMFGVGLLTVAKQ